MSVPEDVSQTYVYELVPDTGVINTLLTIPVMETVGVAVINSLKFAVIVIASEADNKLSSSVSKSVTVGGILSNVITILSVPA